MLVIDDRGAYIFEKGGSERGSEGWRDEGESQWPDLALPNSANSFSLNHSFRTHRYIL